MVLGWALFNLVSASGQAFEGVLHMRMINPDNERYTQLSLKDDRSLLHVTMDSVEISILKDKKDNTTTILKRKGDLHYGFRMDQIVDPSFVESVSAVTYTGQVKDMGEWESNEIIIHSESGEAHAWITKQTSHRLSGLFPEFLGADLNPDQYYRRKAADKEGFILQYEESDPGSASGVLKVDLVPGPVSDITFVIGAEYKVLDQQSVRNFFQMSQTDQSAKQQWEEFSSLFGSH